MFSYLHNSVCVRSLVGHFGFVFLSDLTECDCSDTFPSDCEPNILLLSYHIPLNLKGVTNLARSQSALSIKEIFIFLRIHSHVFPLVSMKEILFPVNPFRTKRNQYIRDNMQHA